MRNKGESGLKWIIAAVVVAAAGSLLWWMYDCSHHKIVSGRLDAMVALMLEAAGNGEIALSDSLARSIYEEALENGDDLHIGYGLYGLGLFSGKNKETERKGNLLAAERKALELGNDSLLSCVYNALGAYSTGVEHNFSDARRYFTLAIHHAEKVHATAYRMKAQCNLSEVARQMHDTVDIAGDLEVYEYAKLTGDSRFLDAAAHHCAYYYLKKSGKAEKALPFIRELRQLGDSGRYASLMMDYYITVESIPQARRYWMPRMAYDSVSPVALYNMGFLLHHEKRYSESAGYLSRADSAFRGNTLFESAPISMKLLQARNYRAQGDPGRAADYYEAYVAARDSADVVRSASETARLRILYNMEKKEREMAAQHQTIMRFALLAGFLGFIIVAGCSGWWYYARRKRKYMKLIVAQNAESDRVIMNMRRHIEELERRVNDEPAAPGMQSATTEVAPLPVYSGESKSGDSISEATMKRIWHTVEQHVAGGAFRDSNLTRDNFAERVGCNHTYLSRVIKENMGVTFQQYLTNVRIDEAKELLSSDSDPGGIKEVAQRVGFISVSTFYTAFKSKTGMSPAQYRKTYLSLAREQAEEAAGDL